MASSLGAGLIESGRGAAATREVLAVLFDALLESVSSLAPGPGRGEIVADVLVSVAVAEACVSDPFSDARLRRGFAAGAGAGGAPVLLLSSGGIFEFFLAMRSSTRQYDDLHLAVSQNQTK
jgi:hypothetical protein